MLRRRAGALPWLVPSCPLLSTRIERRVMRVRAPSVLCGRDNRDNCPGTQPMAADRSFLVTAAWLPHCRDSRPIHP